MKYIPFFLAFFLLFACGENEESNQKSFLNDNKIKASEKIKRIIIDDNLKNLGLNKNEIEFINSFYATRNFNPLFTTDSSLTRKGQKIQEEIENSIYYGVPNQRLNPINSELHPYEKEVLMLVNLSVLVNDLNYGFFDFNSKKIKNKTTFPSSEFTKQINQLDSISISKLLLKQGPNDTNYRFLVKHLYDFCKIHKPDTTHFNLKTAKEDTVNVLGKIKSVLVAKNYIQVNSDSSQVIEALKKYQLENGIAPDASLGYNTVKALNESNYDKILRASIALDRIRSQDKKPSKYVRINLPEFKLYFFTDDSLRSEHRIIIGKVSNQTPELISSINRITCFPYWRVPYSIASKEILPDLKRDKNYLAKHHYKLYSKEIEVDPTTINWQKYNSSFPFQVVQQPGKWNSLGLVKFEFNNSHSVYVHDTPNRNLFKNAFRSYSHGCMRCEFPQELAKTMLKYDSIGRSKPLTAEKFDSIMRLEKNYTIPLKTSVPIFIEYQSVVAYRDRIVFYIDLYGRDKELMAILKKEWS